jgi:hypothetical protein
LQYQDPTPLEVPELARLWNNIVAFGIVVLITLILQSFLRK